jgi:hypothetical protein
MIVRTLKKLTINVGPEFSVNFTVNAVNDEVDLKQQCIAECIAAIKYCESVANDETAINQEAFTFVRKVARKSLRELLSSFKSTIKNTQLVTASSEIDAKHIESDILNMPINYKGGTINLSKY